MLLAAQNDHNMMILVLLVLCFITYGTYRGGIGVKEARTSAECVLYGLVDVACAVGRKVRNMCLPKRES